MGQNDRRHLAINYVFYFTFNMEKGSHGGIINLKSKIEIAYSHSIVLGGFDEMS